MFNDKLSQRILASLLGFSAVILAAAALILSLNTTMTAQAAEEPAEAPIWDDGLRGAVGLGIQDSTGYFIVWGNPNLFYKVDLNKAKDWYSE